MPEILKSQLATMFDYVKWVLGFTMSNEFSKVRKNKFIKSQLTKMFC